MDHPDGYLDDTETLYALTLDTGERRPITQTGSFGYGAARISAGGDRFLVFWSDETTAGGYYYLTVTGQRESISVPPLDRECDDFTPIGQPCAHQGVIAPDGSTIAFLRTIEWRDGLM